MAISTEMEVKFDATSNKTSSSSSFNQNCFDLSNQSYELWIWCSGLPTNGDKILHKYFDNSYVVETTKLSIDRKNTLSLCLFGKPYNLGVTASVMLMLNAVNDNGTISTTVYRKSTHSNRYLQFTSLLPI